MRSSALSLVAPRDCALGVAVPLDAGEFLNDLDPSSGKDFASHFCDENRELGMAQQYYVDLYSRMARGFESACRGAEEAGVSVWRRLTYGDVPTLFADHKVVTIVTHWRFAAVTADDVVDPRRFMDMLRQPTRRFHELVRDEVSARAPQLLAEADTMADGELRVSLARVIGSIVEDAHSAYIDATARAGENDVFAVPLPAIPVLHRITFERAFAGAIRRRGAIELFDGMHSVEELIAAIPPDFDGLIDLTICHSVILAAAIREQREACLVVANRRPAQLRIRLALYELAVRDLAERRRPFLDVLVEHALYIQKRRRLS